MLSSKTWKNIIFSGIFLIPFTGLIAPIGQKFLANFFFPYITPKNLFFRLIILIIATAYAFLLYKKKEYRPVFGTISWSFLIFTIILFIADIFGQYAHKSFFSNFERMEGFFTIFLLFIYYIVVTGAMKTERIWENILNASLLSSFIMAIFAFMESSKGVDRLGAQLGNPTYLAAFMLFNMFFALFLILRRFRKAKDSTTWLAVGIYTVIGLVDLYIFYRTGTRGALLGFIVGVVFMAVLFAFFEKHNVILKRTGYGILAIIIIASSLLLSFRHSHFVVSSPLLSRISGLVSAPTDLRSYASTEGRSRFSIWAIALQGVKERPILGWGQDNFNYVFNSHYDPKIYDQEQWFDRAHNVFFDWLVAGGILGLLSYLSMFVFSIYVLWKKKREVEGNALTFEDKTILTALLIAYFIHNFFVFDSITSYIFFFTVLGYISVHEKPLSSWNKKLNFDFLKNESMQGTMVGAAIILGLVGLYYLVVLPYIASARIIDALTYQNTAFSPRISLTSEQRSEILRTELDLYKNAISHGVVGRAEAHEQLVQNAVNVIRADGIAPDIKDLYNNLVDSEMKMQLEATPEDARYFVFYANYLSNVGRYEESFPYFKRAEELSPNKQSIILEDAIAHINAKKYPEAALLSKQAFEVATGDVEARVLYIVSLIYAGESAQVPEIIAPIKETDPGTDFRIMKAYYDTKQPSKINELLDIKLKIAERLFKEGKREAAIQEIQDVISVNPAYQKQGETMIHMIQSAPY